MPESRSEPQLGVELSAEARSALTFQAYERPAEIDGVGVRVLRKHRAENGWFAELLRLDGGRVQGLEVAEMEVRQLSMSFAQPGRINAFHIHPKVSQNELWTVLEGQLVVWLVDCRAGSRTEGVRQRVILSGEQPASLYIPAGVAHGYRAGVDGALLVYAMDQWFDSSDPNEGRLPWDHFGSGLWADDRG